MTICKLVPAPCVAAAFLSFWAVFLISEPAYAYIGPGAGLSALGTILALLGVVLLLLVGFLWYPIKRLRRRRTEAKRAESSSGIDEESDASRLS